MMSDTTAGAAIHYTIDGTTPTINSLVYRAPLVVSTTTTVRAIATASGFSTSGVASATYTITAAKQATATPTFSLAAGMYTTAVTVVIVDPTPGATIHYTTNGATPTTSSPVYSGPFVANATTTVRAMALASTYNNSAISSAVYTIQLGSSGKATPTPTFSLASGTYKSSQTLAINDAISARIYYSIDGSAPTIYSLPYRGPFTISATTTVRAFADASGYTRSTVNSAVYTIIRQRR